MEFGFGSGILTGLRTDIKSYTPVRFGALQDVSIEFSAETKSLFSLNQFPIDSARGKTKIMGKAKVAQIFGRMYNDLFFGQTLATGSQKYAFNESTNLATAGVTNYTVANSASVPLQDQGVFYGTLTGNQLIGVSSGPTSGQYSFNAATGIYTFSTFDASASILVNYLYTATTGFNIAGGNPLMGNTPQFQATLFQQFEGSQVVLQLYACISERLSFPTRIDDYVIQDLDFSAFATGSGNVFEWSTST